MEGQTDTHEEAFCESSYKSNVLCVTENIYVYLELVSRLLNIQWGILIIPIPNFCFCHSFNSVLHFSDKLLKWIRIL